MLKLCTLILKLHRIKGWFFHPKRFLELIQTISLTNLINNSPYCLSHNSYDVSLENLVSINYVTYLCDVL